MSNVLNDFYVNVAKHIGTDHTPCDITSHPSCHLITSNIPTPIPFDFKPITKENIQSFISKSGSKKATGVDGIPAKIFKSCSRTISEPLSKLINFSLVTSTFPNRLKQAQVIPVYKKKDPLIKHNYRPISILPFVSKLYERSINLQLSAHFENFFNPFLGAFRQGMGCQSTLLRLVEDWRGAAITELMIDNKTIYCDDSVTLLGIEFDNMLTFNNHIASMCKKAARQLAVLKRIGHLLTIKGTLAIFNSFIESNFNYCPLIWHFCSQTNTKKIEKIQERALRFIYNNYPSTHNDLLKTAGTQYLHIKRLKHMACEVFKIVNNMSPSFITNLIEIKTSKYSMRRTKPAVVPKSKTSKYGLKSFAHEGVRVWNSLPNELRRCDNFREFRRLLRCWNSPVCGCSACR